MERRQRLSLAQWEQLVGFFEQNPQLARGYSRSSQARQQASRMWEQLALQLNSDGEGVTKEVKSWSKFWNDYKCKLKKKVQDITADMGRTGGGPPLREVLSNIELRLLAVLGNNFGVQLEGIIVDPFAPANLAPIQVLHNAELDDQNILVEIPLDTPAAYREIAREEAMQNAAPSGQGPSCPPGDQPPPDEPLPQQHLSAHRRGPARQRRARQRNRPQTALDQAHAVIAGIEDKRAEADLLNASSLAEIVKLLSHRIAIQERAVVSQEDIGRQIAGALNNLAESVKTLTERGFPLARDA